MKIKVLAFAAFGEILGREREVELEEEASVKDLLDELASIVPGFREAAFEPSGILRDYVLLMVNRKRIDPERDLSRILVEGDELASFPPLAGG